MLPTTRSLPPIPPLPAGTAIWQEEEDFGPALCWGGPSLMKRCTQLAGTLIAFAIASPIPIIVFLPGYQSEKHWESASWGLWLFAWLMMSLLWYVVALFIALGVWHSIELKSRSSIQLGKEWLVYSPAGPDLAPKPEREKWDRMQMLFVCLEQGIDRQRLLLADGEYQVEIGPSLSDSDRQWLAEVIRAWIPPLRFTPDSPEGEGPSESIQQG